MEKYSQDFDQSIREVSKNYELNNLLNIDSKMDGQGYWPRIAALSFFDKLYKQHRYHFLYEIQGLSNQIHFGIASSLLFREKMSMERGRPNGYNHRYAFMVESTIHTIYSYWNRVALVLNTYLKTPLFKERVYFSKIVRQLEVDYPELLENPHFLWSKTVKDGSK